MATVAGGTVALLERAGSAGTVAGGTVPVVTVGTGTGARAAADGSAGIDGWMLGSKSSINSLWTAPVSNSCIGLGIDGCCSRCNVAQGSEVNMK